MELFLHRWRRVNHCANRSFRPAVFKASAFRVCLCDADVWCSEVFLLPWSVEVAKELQEQSSVVSLLVFPH